MSDLTTQLAKAMFASNAGPRWGGVSKSVREVYIRAADTVIAHLTAAGHLIPTGGMALTAEQVEDVRIVLGLNGSQDIKIVLDAQARLRALFPATEPAEEETKAEYPHRGLGDLTVLGPEIFTNGEVINWRGENFMRQQDPASSPVVPAPTETEWPTWQEVPEGVWFLTNQNIGCWMRRDGDKVTTVTGGWPVCTDSLAAQAPFVAAEEG